jgi:membrane dipeptidase
MSDHPKKEDPSVLIVDAHLDLAWNALQWNRDLTQSAYTIRTQEVAVPGPGRGQGTVSLPELRRGRVALCFGTTLARSTGRPVDYVDYRSPAQASAAAQGHLAYYRALEAQGHARVITARGDLDRHIGDWEAWDSVDQPAVADAPPLGVILSMESADPIRRPEDLSHGGNWAFGQLGRLTMVPVATQGERAPSWDLPPPVWSYWPRWRDWV